VTDEMDDIRTLFEDELTDHGTFTRDPEGTRDDVRDTATGRLVPPPGDADPVYSGPCRIGPLPRARRSYDEAGAEVYPGESLVRVPMSAPALLIGDTFVLDEVGEDGDQSLVGRPFVVTGVGRSSRAALRRLTVLDKERGPRT
jgi:hypothetical protein